MAQSRPASKAACSGVRSLFIACSSSSLATASLELTHLANPGRLKNGPLRNALDSEAGLNHCRAASDMARKAFEMTLERARIRI
jgi:hypothetical protein